MSAKAIFPGALILAAFGGWALAANPPVLPAQGEAAQQPATSPGPIPEVLPNPSAGPPGSNNLPPGPNGLPAGSVPDPWILYTRPDCCGPWGKNGPIGTEFYLRTGPSIPVQTGILHETLATGWMVAGGARTLFFNPATDAAWTADYGLSYTYNNGNRPEHTFDLFGSTVNVREYHRSSLNLAFGREWYLLQPAYTAGRHLRIGFDSGGRYGASRVNLNDVSAPELGTGFLHKYDVFGAFFTAVHSDLEVPIGGCSVFFAGVRAEWNYNWSSILPGQKSDLQDVNLLLNFGFRY